MNNGWKEREREERGEGDRKARFFIFFLHPRSSGRERERGDCGGIEERKKARSDRGPAIGVGGNRGQCPVGSLPLPFLLERKRHCAQETHCDSAHAGKRRNNLKGLLAAPGLSHFSSRVSFVFGVEARFFCPLRHPGTFCLTAIS